MFWGLIMEPGKRYTQTVERAFHVSMACLEPTTADNDNVSVLLAFESREFILCSLNKHKVVQTQLDLNFQSGDKIAFMSSGKGRVHLTGYLLETDDDDDDDEDEDDEDDENELTNNEDSMIDSESSVKKVSSNLPKGSGKRKNEPRLSQPENKKVKLELESDEDKLSSDDDFNFAGDSDDSENEDEEEEDDNFLDDDDEDESEDDDVETSPKQKTPESRKKDKQLIKTPTDIVQNKVAVEKVKTPNDKKQKNVSLVEKQQQKNKTPNEKQQQKNKTPNEKQQQKNKTPNEKQQQKNKTPNEKQQQSATPKSSPGTQGLSPQQQSGKKNKKGQETPKGAKTPGADTPQKKVLEGGVTVDEVRVGNGPVAKPGREVTVYYIGRLKHNNKQFDSTTQGSGFKFRLGRGEVIRGWDIGLNGMKVGGKRKIVCPATMAYGVKGSPPAIPPNSTLVFDVELRAVN